jgi:hypothetical protein
LPNPPHDVHLISQRRRYALFCWRFALFNPFPVAFSFPSSSAFIQCPTHSNIRCVPFGSSRMLQEVATCFPCSSYALIDRINLLTTLIRSLK